MPSSPPPKSSPTSSTAASPATKTTEIDGNNNKAPTRIEDLLRQTMRITTTDGRIFIGTFAGTDKPLNIILVNTDEYRIGQKGDGRYVGQVMFPWKIITKVEAHIKAESRNGSYNDQDMYI